jgi:predicted nucleic-acid-binding protein
MIALDTNVLVRFLVKDDPEQCRRAAALVEEAVSTNQKLFLSDLVLAETAWVLSRAYKFPATKILEALDMVLATRNVAVESPDRARRALRVAARSAIGFADALIAVRSREFGCDILYTFDRRLAGLDGVSEP